VVDVIKAYKSHAIAMAPNMRQQDRDEVWAAYHHGPREALVSSLRVSTKAWTIMLEDEPIGIFGVGSDSLLSETGSPWLLATDWVREIRIQFIRRMGPYLEEMLSDYPVLVNYVDARNTDTLRWLHWWGFRIDEPEPWGLEGLPFHKITMRAS